MSSRQLRKLQQQKELEEAARRAEEEAQAEESEDDSPPTPPSKASLFANLAALEEEEQDEENHSDVEPSSELEEVPKPAAKAKKSKKKKKAKNKGKDKPAEKEDASDDIDAALRELSLQNPKTESWHNSKPTFDPQYEKICELVRIQTQHLKVANEMRTLFGKAALENHDDAGGPVGRGGRRPGARGQPQQVDLETALKGQHLPGKGLPEVTLRRNLFIQGKDDWPKATTGGLTMEVVDDLRHQDGTIEFRFVHDKTYQAVQQHFQAGVEIGDPQRLIVLLTQNPYHISSLIQVSKIAKDQTDHALSHDLLERALFTFGRASLSMFNTKLAEGKARLDFRRPENRELWLAGYQYIKSLMMKGTYRTAFEWAKLLLSLDPDEDPYCMRLMLHSLALRAHEFKWLLEYGEFTLGQESLPEDDRVVQKIAYTLYHNTASQALAATLLKDGLKSRDLLTRSMKRFPWLFVKLFQELNLEAPRSIWGSQPRTDAENLFTSLYVQQTKDLWNTTEGTALLMEIAHTIPKVDEESLPLVSNAEMDLDIVRFVYLDNTPALMALVPSNLLHRSENSDSDPIPPYNSTYSYHVRELPHDARRPGIGIGMNGPMAAIAEMLFNRRGDAQEEDSGDEEQFADMLRNGVGGFDADSDDEDDVAADPRSFVRRMMDLLMGSGRGADDEELENDDTDTDEMPDLVSFEEGDTEGDVEGMPGLIPSGEVEHRYVVDTDTDGETDDEMPPLAG